MKQVVTHGWNLVVGTAKTWVRYMPWLLGFTLFAWAGEYGSLLPSAVAAEHQPYLVILGLSIGLILQLSMIVLALRKVGELSHWTSAPPVGIQAIIDMALLPFLGIYVAFGYVSEYVSNLLYLIQGRTNFYQLSAIMNTLNPVSSRTRLIWVLASLVVLYILGQMLDSVRSRFTSMWLDLVSALVTAFGTFLGVLSVFRISEQVMLWLYDRKIWAWKDQFSAWLSQTFPINVPEVLSEAWSFFATTCWPGFWDLLVQPLVWFALAILVAGGQFIHVDEIVDRVIPPSTNKVVNFLRKDVQGRILGDLDVKVFPILHALRRMWKATVPFLAAYILAFTILTWIGEALEALARHLLGIQSTSTMVIAMPLIDALSTVLILSIKLALLVAAFSQAEKLAAAPPAKKTSVGTTLLIVVLCFVVAVAHTLTAPGFVTTESGSQDQTLTVGGIRVSISDIRVGTTLNLQFSSDVTDQRFVVVHLTAVSDTAHTPLISVLVGSGHTYDTYNDSFALSVMPGFLTETDLIFEVSAADFSHPLYCETQPNILLTSQKEVAKFRLDLSDADLAGSQGRSVSADRYPTQRVP